MKVNNPYDINELRPRNEPFKSKFDSIFDKPKVKVIIRSSSFIPKKVLIFRRQEKRGLVVAKPGQLTLARDNPNLFDSVFCFMVILTNYPFLRRGDSVSSSDDYYFGRLSV